MFWHRDADYLDAREACIYVPKYDIRYWKWEYQHQEDVDMMKRDLSKFPNVFSFKDDKCYIHGSRIKGLFGCTPWVINTFDYLDSYPLWFYEKYKEVISSFPYYDRQEVYAAKVV